MFAIIETGGKQYKVEAGTIIDIEKIIDIDTIEAEEKKEIILDKVLLISSDENVILGKPYIQNAEVKALVLEEVKDKKVIVFKFKNKTGYQKTQGHRQRYTRIKVAEIISPALVKS